MPTVTTHAGSRANRFAAGLAASLLLTPLLRLSGGLAALWRTRRSRREIAGLLAYDDHMLADLGITRSDVASALAAEDLGDASVRLAHLRNERRHAEVRRRGPRRGMRRA